MYHSIAVPGQEAQMMLVKLMKVLKPSNVEDVSNECAICFESFDKDSAMALRGCNHVFCSECLEQLKEQKKCPMCRAPFKEKDKITVEECKAALKKQHKKKSKPDKTTAWDGEEEAPKIVYVSCDCWLGQLSLPSLVVPFVDLTLTRDLFPSTPRRSALLEHIDRMASDEKGVIFSQFTEYLDIIETALHKHSHSFTRIDGSVSPDDRYEAMKALDAEDGPRFILISLRAGGEGITLTR